MREQLRVILKPGLQPHMYSYREGIHALLPYGQHFNFHASLS